MSRRVELPSATTIASLGDDAVLAKERRTFGWWRLRNWRTDLAVLTRVREGLKALPLDAESDAVGAANGQAEEAKPAVATQAEPDPGLVAVRETFSAVAKAGDDAAAYFYAWLFLRRPELRELFPPAMDEQRDRLFRSLARIVESLSTPEEMASYLSQLGRDHRKYGVAPDMYDAVGEALIATLRAHAGPALTDEAADAWQQIYAAGSALMIRAAEEDANTRPARWTAEVVSHEHRGNGIAVLTVAPDDVLPFAAGQHVTLQTPRWPKVWRPYSIACRPREDGLLSLHVKAIAGGWVSNALVSHTSPGDSLLIGPPLGTMTLAHAGDRDLLCVAGGTGLSPIKAITEQAIKESGPGHRRNIFLFCGARTRDELYDMRDLWRLTDAFPWLQLTPVTSDDPAYDGMQGNVGRVAARYVPHKECEAFVAGPADMVRETIRVLKKSGIPRERIHYDDALLAGRPRVGSGT
jgi:NAD(P)H-flavin reductase/hemoglobin-like flavoprotein